MLGAMPLSQADVPPKALDRLHALGCMASEDARELLYETIEGVIAPRLHDYGLDALVAWNKRIKSAGE